MAKARWTQVRWLWAPALVASIAGPARAGDETKSSGPGGPSAASVAEPDRDGARTKPIPGPGRARPELPEVIRTEEHEDVDGRTRTPESLHPDASPPSLKAAEVDALILRGLKASKTEPSPITNDEEFLRRVYLDVLGKLPEPNAIREFVGSKLADKRALLIDNLLGQPAYAENWARYWRDVVSYRSPNENDRQVNYPRFEKWLAEQFAANKPWDRIVTEILTASGRVDENGATAFALAEESKAVEIAGEASRIFLGIQIQCAQCHDHPSDPWKRQQFHEFAAFFAGVRSEAGARQGRARRKIPIFMIDGRAARPTTRCPT